MVVLATLQNYKDHFLLRDTSHLKESSRNETAIGLGCCKDVPARRSDLCSVNTSQGMAIRIQAPPVGKGVGEMVK